MENLELNDINENQQEVPAVETDHTAAERALLFDFVSALENARSEDIDEQKMTEDTWDDDFFKSLGIDFNEAVLQPEELPEPEQAATDAEQGAEENQPEESSADPQGKKKQKDPWQKSVLLYLHDLAFLLAGIILVFLLLFRVVIVSGSSMYDTLCNGDFLLLISNVFYQEPKQGDIIVASKESFKNGAPIVKRVIATEGQWVYIDFDAGIVYVGDDSKSMRPLDEPYTIGKTTQDEGVSFPLQVSEGCVFVMGDNRNDSKDSRHPEIGLIDNRQIMGKVIFLFMPGEDMLGQRDFGRIGAVS